MTWSVGSGEEASLESRRPPWVRSSLQASASFASRAVSVASSRVNAVRVPSTASAAYTRTQPLHSDVALPRVSTVSTASRISSYFFANSLTQGIVLHIIHTQLLRCWLAGISGQERA